MTRLSLLLAILVVVACVRDQPAGPSAGVGGSTDAGGEGGAIAAAGDGGRGGAGRASAGEGGRSSAGEGAAARGDRDASVLTDASKPPSDDADVGDSDGGGSPAHTSATLEQLMASYPGWTKRTPEPQSITVEIFSLCRAPTLPEQQFVESKHGKDRLQLLDWLNEAAVAGFEAGGRPGFAVGAAIVKEKIAPGSAGQLRIAALGLMVKRPGGFDPAHGDWEFGYWEMASGLTKGGALQSYCGNCHASSKTDFVFVDRGWRVPR